MKVIDKKTIALWKKPHAIMPKIDYTMNTKYYRVVQPRRVFEKLVEDEHGKGELATFTEEAKTLGASVDPLEALKLMVGNKAAELQEVML